MSSRPMTDAERQVALPWAAWVLNLITDAQVDHIGHLDTHTISRSCRYCFELMQSAKNVATIPG